MIRKAMAAVAVSLLATTAFTVAAGTASAKPTTANVSSVNDTGQQVAKPKRPEDVKTKKECEKRGWRWQSGECVDKRVGQRPPPVDDDDDVADPESQPPV